MGDWNSYFTETANGICPFMRSRPWVFVPKDIEVMVIELDCSHSPDFLNLVTRVMQPQLISLNLEAVPLHPEHPMRLKDGRYTRRSPTPALNIIRHDVAGEAYRALEKGSYYENFPDDWQRHFPGLEGEY